MDVVYETGLYATDDPKVCPCFNLMIFNLRKIDVVYETALYATDDPTVCPFFN